MSWRRSINQAVGVARIADIGNYVRSEVPASESPIDNFYKISQDLITVGDPPFLLAHPTIASLLIVGIVSATENYFRDVFGRIIKICPIAKSASSEQSINLGSVMWHGGLDIERSAFEHISFADVNNITKTCKNYINYQISKAATMLEFEKVCQLRHGIVHSGAIMAGKNAIRLQIPTANGKLKINIGYPQLQECSNICTTLVASVNTELFIEMAKRWAIEWPKIPSWEPSKRHFYFKAIWNTFYSVRDATNGTIPVAISLIKCRNLILSEYT